MGVGLVLAVGGGVPFCAATKIPWEQPAIFWSFPSDLLRNDDPGADFVSVRLPQWPQYMDEWGNEPVGSTAGGTGRLGEGGEQGAAHAVPVQPPLDLRLQRP